MTDLVFVYGTLKKGYSNHQLFKQAEFLAHATTSGIMLNLGAFPAIINGKARVFGELYKITPEILAFLDRLEGHPHFYERKLVDLKTQDIDEMGEDIKAWCYFLSKGAQEYYQEVCPIIKNGVWDKKRL